MVLLPPEDSLLDPRSLESGQLKMVRTVLRRGGARKMDAIEMLLEEHKMIRRMFREFEDGELAAVADFCRELLIHSDMEEAIFYPAVREAVDDSKDIVLEGIAEHHAVKLLIYELNAMTPDNDFYKAKATVVRQNTEHHFGEEESEMFPQIRQAMTRERLEKVAERMANYRSHREQGVWAGIS
jgi:hemerythrin superfamily protein